MKVVFVVDNISDLNNKINLLQNKFGSSIYYVVRADLVDFFKTYGHLPNAIYYKNLTEVTHSLLAKSEIDDAIICYSSLKINDKLLTQFINNIGNRTQIVSFMPDYNTFEHICNKAYNIYVKSLFKTKDSLISNKLQFLPKDVMVSLLESHLGNRLFETNPERTKYLTTSDKAVNDSLKTKSYSIKYDLISLIIALVLTVGLLCSIAYYKVSYLIILGYIILLVLDITLTIIFHCKDKFDQRFLK